MLRINSSSTVAPSQPFTCLVNGSSSSKRKRRPAGTPDPDAEVVSLSPKILLESDRYICEICNQGFQRDQNLQMHRRRHKVPWKLLKRETPMVRKRVFVCPEPSCLHHDPCHALGDLVGIKKHFRRKHSDHKQWVCDKCSKAYAVQSDYKAHLKTCGTRGHSCDCGRVFSRVESFIEHQDACDLKPKSVKLQPTCLSRTASTPSFSNDTNFITAPWPIETVPHTDGNKNTCNKSERYHNWELQLSTILNPHQHRSVSPPQKQENQSTLLQLSIGSCGLNLDTACRRKTNTSNYDQKHLSTGSRANDEAFEQLRLAMAEKSYAEEARQQSKRQVILAEQDFANAKRIRQQAKAELDKALGFKEDAINKFNSIMLQITCHACKKPYRARIAMAPHEDKYNNSLS